MARQAPVDLRVSELVKRVLPWIVLLVGFGALPTWLATGSVMHLWAELAGVLIVLVVMGVNGYVTVLAGREGPRRVALVFMASSMLRLFLCPLLLGGVWLATKLPIESMAIWTAVTYLACLLLESMWVLRALRRHRKRVGPEEPTEQEKPKYTNPEQFRGAGI